MRMTGDDEKMTAKEKIDGFEIELNNHFIFSIYRFSFHSIYGFQGHARKHPESPHTPFTVFLGEEDFTFHKYRRPQIRRCGPPLFGLLPPLQPNWDMVET